MLAAMHDDDTPAQTLVRQDETLETLRQRASDLAREAKAVSDRYERTAWIPYMSIFVPIPLLVLLFRLHMGYWGYYLLGASFLGITVTMFAIDAAAAGKRDAAIDAARRASEAYDQARHA